MDAFHPGTLLDWEDELERALDEMDAISDNLQADGLHDADRPQDEADDQVAYNPFACDADTEDNVSEPVAFMEPQPKFQARRKFDSFATVDGHSFQRTRSSGSTDYSDGLEDRILVKKKRFGSKI